MSRFMLLLVMVVADEEQEEKDEFEENPIPLLLFFKLIEETRLEHLIYTIRARLWV